MPSNMPDARAVNEALRRAREMQNRSAPPQVQPESPKEAPIPAPEPKPLPPPQKPATPLGFLLKDKERTLILALLLLLSTEENNTELLFALMYLLL